MKLLTYHEAMQKLSDLLREYDLNKKDIELAHDIKVIKYLKNEQKGVEKEFRILTGGESLFSIRKMVFEYKQKKQQGDLLLKWMINIF